MSVGPDRGLRAVPSGGPEENGSEASAAPGGASVGDAPGSESDLPGSVRDDPAPSGRRGPPGSGTFSLENRPAPGLYVVAWLLALAGVGLFVVAGGAASSAPAGRPAGGVAVALLFVAFLALALACASAAGYQVLARIDRRADRYRGPSPLILAGVVICGTTFVVGLLSVVGLIAPQSDSIGALVDVALTTCAYLRAIWLFVVRTGAMGWPAMGWPAGWRSALPRLVGDAVAGVAVILPTYLVTVLVGAVLATLLGARLPELPIPRTGPDVFFTIVAAVVIAPIGEESFFRGLSLTAWWRDLGLRSALLRSTLFFAAAHILNVTATSAGDGLRTAILQFVVILPVGYVLGWLFSQRGIVASIAGHMTFNAVGVLLLVASGIVRV